jgi:hypothetical protein
MTYYVRIHESGDGTLSESNAQVSENHCMHLVVVVVVVGGF